MAEIDASAFRSPDAEAKIERVSVKVTNFRTSTSSIFWKGYTHVPLLIFGLVFRRLFKFNKFIVIRSMSSLFSLSIDRIAWNAQNWTYFKAIITFQCKLNIWFKSIGSSLLTISLSLERQVNSLLILLQWHHSNHNRWHKSNRNIHRFHKQDSQVQAPIKMAQVCFF